MNTQVKDRLRERRKFRIRKKLHGSAQRPRLTITRSNRHFMLQVINDDLGITLVSAFTVEKDMQGKFKGNNMTAAKEIAGVLAERAKAKGIIAMVFDRNGYRYHGRVKQIADSLREHGIQI